jgi:hypothetical protein
MNADRDQDKSGAQELGGGSRTQIVLHWRPMFLSSFWSARESRLESGRLRNRPILRSSKKKASRKALVCSAGSRTAAGSGTPQCAVIGCPGHTGQTSLAALSQTVKTKSRAGAPGSANSSQDSCYATPQSECPADFNCFIASWVAVVPRGGCQRCNAVKFGCPFQVQNGLRHDGARRVAGAEKENVAMFGHGCSCSFHISDSRKDRSSRLAACDRLGGANESAKEFAFHLRGDRVHIDALPGQELHERLRRCRYGWARFRCCRNPAASKLGAIVDTLPARRRCSQPKASCSGDISGFRRDHHIGDGETAAGLEHAEGFAQDAILVGGEIDDAVGDDDIDRVVGQGDVLDFALEELDVLDAGFALVFARQSASISSVMSRP